VKARLSPTSLCAVVAFFVPLLLIGGAGLAFPWVRPPYRHAPFQSAIARNLKPAWGVCALLLAVAWSAAWACGASFPVHTIVVLLILTILLYVVGMNRSYPSRRVLPFGASFAALTCALLGASLSASEGTAGGVVAGALSVVASCLILLVVVGLLDAQGAEALRETYVRDISS
jgi:hypothetical protein